MKTKSEHKKYSLKKAIIIVLIFFCFISFEWFISTFNQLKKGGDLRAEYSITGRPTNLRHTFNINEIKIWMTFDYINTVFKLNPDYLKNALNIVDSRYPNITINSYTRHHHINPQFFMQSIDQAIINYPQGK